MGTLQSIGTSGTCSPASALANGDLANGKGPGSLNLLLGDVDVQHAPLQVRINAVGVDIWGTGRKTK